MAECSECGKQTMSFTCHYCGEKFCAEHRLPENHDCDGLETGKKDKYMPNKSKKDSEKKTSKSKQKTGKSGQQKWFKQENLKQEKKTGRHSRPGLFQDIIYTLKNNYTLSIILVTSIFFLLQNFFPGMGELLRLYPALTQQAAASAGYSATVLSQPWGIISVMLVHGGMFHLFANMITFYFFGNTLEKNIGGKNLVKFYVTTGILASIGYIVFSNLLYYIHGATLTGGLGPLTPAVGASGAVVAAVGAIAVLYPDAEVLLYFVIPMKIKSAVGLFGAIETFNLIAKLGGITLPVIGGFASSAHLIGLAAGIILGKQIKKQYGRKRRVNIFQ